MTIHITCENLAEVKAFAAEILGGQLSNSSLLKEELISRDMQEPKQTGKKEEYKQSEEQELEIPVQEDQVDYTLFDVREKLGALQKAGKRAQVQELIQSYGVEKLTQIPQDQYPGLMKKAEEI